MNDFKLPIYHILYQLVKYMYKITRNMPREYKYGIGQDAINLGWECLDRAAQAGYLQGERKNEAIRQLSCAFDRFKLRVRLASEIGAISAGCFAHIQENYLCEAGKQIGGWQKWAESDK